MGHQLTKTEILTQGPKQTSGINVSKQMTRVVNLEISADPISCGCGDRLAVLAENQGFFFFKRCVIVILEVMSNMNRCHQRMAVSPPHPFLLVVLYGAEELFHPATLA